MGDPKTVYGIMAWEVNGPYLFTALLKVSDQARVVRKPVNVNPGLNIN